MRTSTRSHAIHHNFVIIHSLSMEHKLLNRYLAELPAILDDKFFTGIANTTSTYIGVEGGSKES